MQQLANNHPAINLTYHIIMVFAICTIITLIVPFLNFFFIKKSCMCVGGILYLPRTFLRDVGTQLLILFGCWLEIQHKTIPKKVAKKFGVKLLDLQQQVAVSKPKCPIIFKAIILYYIYLVLFQLGKYNQMCHIHQIFIFKFFQKMID